MNNQNVTEMERWVVKNNVGDVVARFANQTKAIDFANREQKSQKGIVLIDIAHCTIQLIARPVNEEQVS